MAEKKQALTERQGRAMVKEEKPPSDVQVWREFEHAMLDMERRMDRVLRETFEQIPEPWTLPLLSGLTLQRGPNGTLRFRPFGHLQETIDTFLEGWREPALTWKIDEKGQEVEFRCEVPGLGKDDLKVEVQPDLIHIEGSRNDAKYRATCSPGVRLNPDQADADYDNGILHLKVGLAEPRPAKGRSIKIR